jgi:hypothetical protein
MPSPKRLACQPMGGRWWSLQEAGPSGRTLGHWGCTIDRGYWNTCPFFSLFPDCYDMISFALPSTLCHDVLPHCKSKNNGASQPWTEILESVSQNEPFLLFSWLSQVFCHSDGKLRNTWCCVLSEYVLFEWMNFKTESDKNSRAGKISPLKLFHPPFSCEWKFSMYVICGLQGRMLIFH